MARAGLQRRVDLVRLPLADQVSDRGGGYQHLGCYRATATISGLAQGLADDTLQPEDAASLQFFREYEGRLSDKAWDTLRTVADSLKDQEKR